MVVPVRPTPAPGPGEVHCGATRQGIPMTASYTLRGSGGDSYAGRCGAVLRVPPGRYEATLVLDGPENRGVAPLRRNVVVRSAEETRLDVNFEVGTLEVRLLKGLERIPGSADIYQGDRWVASTADGRGLFLSPGAYTVWIRTTPGFHGPAGRVEAGERQMSASLQAGQRRALRARF